MSLPFPVPWHLFPVQHRFLELDGARIHYVDEGSGDTLLLLHGNPSWSFLYRKMIPALRDRFRCVALDYPGYGMSDPPPVYGFTPLEHSAFVSGQRPSEVKIVHQLIWQVVGVMEEAVENMS
jgi:haloalkane dehalogenase